ncbi:cysteine--tRNA ligase [Patescibacteria group bacterium]|nr:cysteine--tRNA ligase [Patescibacteria group bacterium]MBU0963715.1 cysteine--tRNA ligase [Patescibacteria group bacterium]
MLSFYNTLTRKKEAFKPLNDKEAGLYTCGPTVYNYAHLGNLRTYLFEDILKRVLINNGYAVKHVMNITDVGHLTSDADEGEDKIETSALKEKKTVWEIAEFYTKSFKQSLADLNISEPDIWCKATDHIQEQIAWIKKLEEKGFTYKISDGLYFDTSKFGGYEKLRGQKTSDMKEGARVEKNTEKKNPSDFALWKFSPQDSKRQMEWNSPWGKGFPGWHLECSVMAQKYLGETFDLHCGGIDHIPTHHTNEIAQAEAVTEKPFVNYWLHGEFLVIGKDVRMGKSEGNFITLNTVKEKNVNPLAYRYLVLGTHYRKKLNFTWEALQAAQNALDNLYALVANLGEPKIGCAEFEQKFSEAINDDLNTPKSLAIVWDLLKSDYPNEAKKASLLAFDKIIGLNLRQAKPIAVPKEIKELADKREQARQAKDFTTADKLRDEINKAGFKVEDTLAGPVIKK